MAKISEIKLASIINEELMDNIQEGLNLHQNLSQTSQNLNGTLSNIQIAAKELSSDAKNIESLSKNIPKLAKFLRLSHIVIGLVLGVALSSIGYGYIVSKLTASNISLSSRAAKASSELEQIKAIALEINSQNAEYIMRYQALNGAIMRLSPRDQNTILKLYDSEYKKLKEEQQ